LIKKYYISKIFLNNNKFNSLSIINLNKLINNIYKKKSIINIINIKYAYLNNNILIDNILSKLNDRKKGVLRVLKKLLKLIKIAEINPIVFLKKNKLVDNKSIFNIGKYNNFVNIFLSDKYKFIIKCIKSIHIIGIYIEAKGRLTKRMTASRSVYKLKSKGNLKNMYTSHYKTSSLLLRGLLKSNINSINKNSKNKNGSYGISSKLNTF
jgi:hypothetical protein